MNVKTKTALYNEETGTYIVKLESGVYEHEGKVFEVKNSKEETILTSDKNLYLLTYENVLKHYFNVNDVRFHKTVEEYEEEREKLLKNAEREESEYGCSEYYFEDLDEEYAYKKFMRKWKAYYEAEVTRKEEIVLVAEKLLFDTGNKFIRALYSVSGEVSHIYVYNRKAATMDAFHNVCKELGLVFSEDKNAKTYHNSSHSHLRYAKVCGNYVFGEKYDERSMNDVRSTLNHLTKLYEDDVKEIETIVKSAYNIYNNKVNLDLARYAENLRSLRSSILDIDAKQKSRYSHSNAIKIVNTLIKSLQEDTANGG